MVRNGHSSTGLCTFQPECADAGDLHRGKEPRRGKNHRFPAMNLPRGGVGELLLRKMRFRKYQCHLALRNRRNQLRQLRQHRQLLRGSDFLGFPNCTPTLWGRRPGTSGRTAAPGRTRPLALSAQERSRPSPQEDLGQSHERFCAERWYARSLPLKLTPSHAVGFD